MYNGHDGRAEEPDLYEDEEGEDGMTPFSTQQQAADDDYARKYGVLADHEQHEVSRSLSLFLALSLSRSRCHSHAHSHSQHQHEQEHEHAGQRGRRHFPLNESVDRVPSSADSMESGVGKRRREKRRVMSASPEPEVRGVYRGGEEREVERKMEGQRDRDRAWAVCWSPHLSPVCGVSEITVRE